MKQKNLVIVQYPFTNQKGSKVRPAIIISNDSYNKHGNDLICIPVTSHIKKDKYSFPLIQTNLKQGNLITNSVVKYDKLFSIDKKLIYKKIGEIENTHFNNLILKINEIISNR